MDSWSPQTVTANGVTLAYYRRGSGAPVVLAHGITDSGLCWLPVARRLAERFDVIMYDARGHGRSESPPSGYTLADYAADLAGLVRALGLQRPAVLGHSMGAATAALAAASNPGLFSRVALEDPPWMALPEGAPPPDPTERFEQWRAQVVENKRKTREELLALGRAQSPRWSEEELEPWAEAKQQVNPEIFSGIRTIGEGWQEMVPQITCPTLLITGDPAAGAIVTPAMVEKLRGLKPDLQVAHVPGAGHSIRREGLEAYMAAVEEFLGG